MKRESERIGENRNSIYYIVLGFCKSNSSSIQIQLEHRISGAQRFAGKERDLDKNQGKRLTIRTKVRDTATSKSLNDVPKLG